MSEGAEGEQLQSTSPVRSKSIGPKERKERRLLRRHVSQLLEMDSLKRNLFCKMRGLDVSLMKEVISKAPAPKNKEVPRGGPCLTFPPITPPLIKSNSPKRKASPTERRIVAPAGIDPEIEREMRRMRIHIEQLESDRAIHASSERQLREQVKELRLKQDKMVRDSNDRSSEDAAKQAAREMEDALRTVQDERQELLDECARLRGELEQSHQQVASLTEQVEAAKSEAEVAAR